MAKVVDGIPKRDAAKQLGISERTLDRKIYDLGITCEQITVPGRRPLVVLSQADFAQLKEQMIPVEGSPPEEMATRLPAVRSSQDLVALLKTVSTLPQIPQMLGIKAASVYSGLTETFLRRKIQARELPAVMDAGWKIPRIAIDEMVLQIARNADAVRQITST